MTKRHIQVSDTVVHNDVNLWDTKGTVVDIDLGERGGDCHVRWPGNLFISEECSFNLAIVEKDGNILINDTLPLTNKGVAQCRH